MSCFDRYAGICAPVWCRVGKFGFGFEMLGDHLAQCPAVPHALAAGVIGLVTRSARVEIAMSRWKQPIGDGWRSHMNVRRATEVAVAVHALNRMPELGRPIDVRIA